MITTNNKIQKVKKKLLCPKIDVVFRSLFRVGHEDITKALISEIIKEEIKQIDINKDRVQTKQYAEEKMGILDLKATLNNNTICNIEVQLVEKENDIERFLYYWSKEYGRQLVQGEEYSKLKRTIGIWILDYEINKEEFRKIKKCHTKWRIREEEINSLILTNKLDINIIELPKVKRQIKTNPENKVIQWMMFLDNPNCMEVKEIMVKNKEIKKAMEDLEEISDDYEVRRIAELREKYILDYTSDMNSSKRQGIEEGLKEGETRERMNIAKKMLYKNIDIETIADLTGLTKEEIEKL